MKQIYIDFETTNLSPFKAKILQFTVIFCENFEVIEIFDKKIKVEVEWSKFEKSDIEALNFNKIYNQSDLNKHNLNAEKIKEVLSAFLIKIKAFSSTKLALSGWNNAMYDNIILKRLLEENNLKFQEYFDYHSHDISCQFVPFYELFFKEKIERPSLESVHRYLIGTFSKEKFHDAVTDCLATRDIDKWIFENIKKLDL